VTRSPSVIFYCLNRRRLAQWDPEPGLTEQCASFQQHHQALQRALQCMHEEAARMVAAANDEGTPSAGAARAPGAELSKGGGWRSGPCARKPHSTRMTIRLLSISSTFSATTSAARSPAP
jgi:hypothetical protein